MKNYSEDQLEDFFDVGDIEVENVEGTSTTSPDVPPVLVFLLPGIRSDKGWAYVFTHRSLSPTARIIIPQIITGPKDLGASDLIFRHRMNCFRSDYLKQISTSIKIHTEKYDNLHVVFVCHSMGSVIFSDIYEDIKKIKSKNSFQVKNIIFLGSIARRTVSEKLCGHHNFINDVGQRDFWPVVAWYINPLKYDPVGRFGFGRGMVIDRIFEINNHTSCTEMQHLENWVVPIVEDEIIKMSEISSKKTYYNRYRMGHRAVWTLLPLSSLYLFFAALGVV